MTSLYGLTRGQLEARLSADRVKVVHAAGLWRALYHDTRAWSAIDWPPPLARWIQDHVGTSVSHDLPTVSTTTRSDDGRTVKYLLGLADGVDVETVAMGYPGRVTACVSTQAGCAMGCVFCATGQAGFRRQLDPGEIVAQVQHVRRVLAERGERLRNLVLMGMGEPLNNYDAVMQALEILGDRGGANIGPGRITVNTVGVVPGIVRMARERRPYHLGVSLHGTSEEERAALVPVTERWPLAAVLDACRVYSTETGRRIFYAWTLIAGVNDSPDHAARLASLLAGLPAHVNLIRLNATGGYAGQSSPEPAADRFRRVLQAAGIPCTIRQRRGTDVAAGCGQLASAGGRHPARSGIRTSVPHTP